jgi:hypothetical protein
MVPPSVHGRLVSSTYCVQLVCETDLVCTGIPPFVNLPIKVHSNLCMKQFVPQYPPNWHPMMMQPMVLPMSVAPYVVNQAPPMLGDNNLMHLNWYNLRCKICKAFDQTLSYLYFVVWLDFESMLSHIRVNENSLYKWKWIINQF